MNSNNTPTTGRRTVNFCIWTLRHQTRIARQIRIYTWAGSLLILLLALTGRLSLEAVLHGIVISLAGIVLLLWVLITARRKSLLNIREPALRERAHRAMLEYLYGRHLSVWEKKQLSKKFGRRYCALGHC